MAKRAAAGSAAVLARAVLLAAPAVLSGCASLPPALGGTARSARDAIVVSPRDGARDVRPDAQVEVRVREGRGRLVSVRVARIEDARRQEVPGRIARDGRSWRPTGERAALGLAAAYRVDAVMVDAAGRHTARRTAFTTAAPAHRFSGRLTPENRSTVGTGAIVSVRFDRPVRDRAAVERAIRVTTVPTVEVAGHWFGDARLDLRPARYWAPGTRVSVVADLRDVRGAPGVYGDENRTVVFTVGRSQTSRVDVAAHTMEVRRDGQLVATVPVTAGRRGADTYAGTLVVSEMLDETRMDGGAAGLAGPRGVADVPHALRLTGSGLFLHGDYWSDKGVFGRTDVSRGSIGLSDVRGGGGNTPAGWFFGRSLVGDVIEVVNSRGRPVAPDDGLGGWNLSWPRWKAGSALR